MKLHDEEETQVHLCRATGKIHVCGGHKQSTLAQIAHSNHKFKSCGFVLKLKTSVSTEKHPLGL